MKRILLRTAMGVAVSLVAIAWTSPALADSYDFSGAQFYWTYAAKTKEVLQNGPCAVTATLDFVGGKNVELWIREACPGGDPRFYPLTGKMTRSGSLKLSMPDFIVEIVKAHTGCTVVGPFPKYQGMFRDGVLHAETHFYSQCNVHWPANDIFDTPVDGPVHWKWTLHLELTP